MSTVNVFEQHQAAREERRKYPRIRVPLQTELHILGGRMPFRVETSDISLGGFYVEMNFTLQVGSRLDISMWLDDRKIKASGIVVTCTPHFGNGIEFRSISDEDLAFLASFLDRAMGPQKTAPNTVH